MKTFAEFAEKVNEWINDREQGHEPTEIVIEELATAEIKRRANLLRQGYDKIQTLETDRAKIRPEDPSYDEDGNPVGSPVYSSQNNKKRKDLTQKIDALDNALAVAYAKGEYAALEKAVK